MTDNEMESGFELILDNRRLIAAFAIFVVICGSFFVIGYTTGKRQGELAAAASGTAGTGAASAGAEGASSEVPPMQEDELRKDLGWYQSVSDGEGEPPGITPSSASESTVQRAARNSANDLYSVQVGAFKTRLQADAHAADVRSRGFDDVRVEGPTGSGPFFVVRVGRFNTMPEAIQEQLQLKKKGFECLIKTN